MEADASVCTNTYGDNVSQGSSTQPTVTASSDNNSLTRRDSPAVSEASWVAETNCCGAVCCNPRRPHYRFIALIFMCFLGFGSYFCYDTPASLQNQIKNDMGVSTLQFSMLYALYSWPNVVLCFVGGFLIDRVFGIRLGTLIFSTIVTVGQFVYAFGAIIGAYWVMEFGRFIFGIGGESLAVAQNTYAVSWFKGKELNTVFGLQLSMARIGSTVNFLIMEPIYDWVSGREDGHTTLGISLIIAGFMCVFSLACAVVIAVLDRRRARVLHIASAQVGDKIQLKDIGGFPLSFWLLSVICVAYYSGIFPFIGLSKVFFIYKYGFSDAKANSVSSIVYIISAVASPMFGFLVDRVGRNIMFVGVASVVTLASHCMLAFTFINPYIAMVLMGLSYSLLASSLWPMIALILPESQLGTAYGIMQSIQNLGLATVSMLSGYIVDEYGYLLLELLNIVCLSAAVVATGVIFIVDSSRDGGYLMKAASGRAAESPMVLKLTERARKLREKQGLVLSKQKPVDMTCVKSDAIKFGHSGLANINPAFGRSETMHYNTEIVTSFSSGPVVITMLDGTNSFVVKGPAEYGNKDCPDGRHDSEATDDSSTDGSHGAGSIEEKNINDAAESTKKSKEVKDGTDYIGKYSPVNDSTKATEKNEDTDSMEVITKDINEKKESANATHTASNDNN